VRKTEKVLKLTKGFLTRNSSDGAKLTLSLYNKAYALPY
jgi:hypothetical protein